MNANHIVEDLLERIKNLTREVAFLSAQLKNIEEQAKQAPEGVDPNAI